MSHDGLSDQSPDVAWYEDDIPVRGCELSLPRIKAAYRELSVLTRREGERIVGLLKKADDVSEEDFQKRNEFLKGDAFKLTVSIIGFDGSTAYGESENIFDSKNLPFPIKAIFFTNANSFKPHANGDVPRNRFYVWLHFSKPPLFDPNPLVSDPTPNESKVELKAEDVVYFRAVQNIVASKLSSTKRWHSFIHQKFAYDLGLWFIALPYSLYWITTGLDRFFPASGHNASFRIAFYIYGLGSSLFLYRALIGYVKWAIPVNTLEENKDKAFRHRVILSGIVLALAAAGVQAILEKLIDF